MPLNHNLQYNLYKVFKPLFKHSILLLFGVSITAIPLSAEQDLINANDSVRFFTSQTKKYHEILDDFEKADSISSYFIDWSNQKSEEIQLKAIYNYFENPTSQSSRNLSTSITLGEKALKISKNLESPLDIIKSSINLSIILALNNDTGQAKSLVIKAREMSKNEGLTYYKAKSYLVEGNLLKKERKIKSALEAYLEAVKIGEQTRNDSLLYDCYESLSTLYKDYNLIEKANSYRETQINSALRQNDSNSYAWSVYYKLGLANSPGNELPMDSLKLFELIDYAKRKNHVRLVNYCFALYRTHLISNDRYKLLDFLCQEQFKEEFKSLKNRRPHVYFRIKAMVYESNQNYDSSYYFYQKALKAFDYAKFPYDSKSYELAHYNFRYAEFLQRRNETDNSIIFFKKALSYFKNLERSNVAQIISGKLEEIYFNLSQFDSAYHYSNLEKQYNRNYLEVIRRDELTRMELEYEVEKRENETLEEKEKRKTQFVYFATGLTTIMFFGFLLFIQFRKTKRQKKISEDLLLNILPKETAIELREKGKTTAKRFENTTVLFADIKGFTKISESLSPEKLVNDLDIYFQAFDRIITKYGLEKIKTIGDAYLAVGGVPESNSAGPLDVINAAIEMLQFTEEMKAQREKENRSFFEIRVGCNTGPLIAGVVGTKKFQYDIWGDTVNVAARMEQSGEVGKINVSRSTKDSIKPDITCTYRGKIMAKNKGEIEMYFVNMPKRDV